MFHIFSFILLSYLSSSQLILQNTISPHSSQITDLSFTADYSYFITTADTKFVIWESANKSIITQKILNAPINGIGINPSTNQIIALLKNGKVQIYNFQTITFKSSYDYPNSGYGNKITFISNGSMYFIGGLDTGKSPLIHFYDKNHNYLTSIQTTFNQGSQITQIFNVVDVLIFLVSNQATYPVKIQMYSYEGTQYVLKKILYESSGRITGMSISLDAQSFYSVGQDLTFRTYKKNPVTSLYQVASTQSYDQNPLAIFAIMPGVTYVSTQKEIIEYFKSGEVSLESHYKTSSAINRISMIYPSLICTTRGGQVLFYRIQFFDGTDHDMKKWIILSSVMGSVILILLVGLSIECYIKKKREKQENGEQNKQLNNENGQ